MLTDKEVNAIKPEYIECDCGSEIIQLQYIEDENCLNMSFFSIGKKNNKKMYSWKDKIIHILHIIRYGHPFSDSIILNKQEIKILEEFLNKINRGKK